MPNDLSWLRSWRVPAAIAPLFIISIYNVFSVVSEQRDRSYVIAHGLDGQARVVRAAGLESVLIEWMDEAGQQRTAESQTGKVFARSSAGMTALIRYDPTSDRKPVILSQVSERERVDTFWFRSSLSVLAGLAIFCAAAFLSILYVRRMRAGASPK